MGTGRAFYHPLVIGFRNLSKISHISPTSYHWPTWIYIYMRTPVVNYGSRSVYHLLVAFYLGYDFALDFQEVAGGPSTHAISSR